MGATQRPGMQAGDLIFVRPSAGDWVGEVVARTTHGPYCHVRIAISGDEVVEALPSGIARAFIHPPRPEPADIAAVGAALDLDRRARALGWLIQQVHDRYGWLDILADGVQMLLPPALGSRTPFLVGPHAYDCSDLGSRFLIRAGYKWLPDDVMDCPSRVSPNGLARALGVLKS